MYQLFYCTNNGSTTVTVCDVGRLILTSHGKHVVQDFLCYAYTRAWSYTWLDAREMQNVMKTGFETESHLATTSKSPANIKTLTSAHKIPFF